MLENRIITVLSSLFLNYCCEVIKLENLSWTSKNLITLKTVKVKLKLKLCQGRVFTAIFFIKGDEDNAFILKKELLSYERVLDRLIKFL